MFENIKAQAGNTFDTAFRLGELAKNEKAPEVHFDALTTIKEDVNMIGSELQSLDRKRDSLAPWQVKALDQTIPLMREVADSAEKAIQATNARQPLRGTTYFDNIANISADADQVTVLLHDYIRLEKTREKELQIEHSLAEGSGF